MSYSVKPAWLLESFNALSKFEQTSKSVRESFNELNVSFTDFDNKAEAAAKMDRQHLERLHAGPKRRQTQEERLALAGAKAARHKWVSLPYEIHSRIIMFFDLFDVDNLLCVGSSLRKCLMQDEIWMEWCLNRWAITGADLLPARDDPQCLAESVVGEGESVRTRVGGSWLMTCATRAAVLRPALQLCEQCKHYRTIHSDIGTGNLQDWIVLLSGIVFLFSAKGDWRSRRMIRKRGGARFFVGLANHNSHRIKTAALAIIANALACNDSREKAMWTRNLKGNLAPKVFSSLLISPLSDVSSNTSREAARALGNMSLLSPVLCYEHEVDACGDNFAHAQSRDSVKSDFSWESSRSWKMQMCYQSGGLCVFSMDELVLNFTDLPTNHSVFPASKVHQTIFKTGGVHLLTGSCFDGEGHPASVEQGYRIEGKQQAPHGVLTVRGCYRFSQNSPGMGECVFTLYRKVDGTAHNSSASLENMRALRNFRGYCSSQSRGWWGVWSNAGSTSDQRRAVALKGGGVFQMTWDVSASAANINRK